MSRCSASTIQQFMDWVLNQPGGMREHVLAVRVSDSPVDPPSFVPDVYEGVLTYYPYLKRTVPGKIGPDIKAILTGTAHGIGLGNLQVTIGIGYEEYSVKATVVFSNRRVNLQDPGMDCNVVNNALQISGHNDNDFVTIEVDKVTTFRNVASAGVVGSILGH
jgi:hypothetical protein